MPSAYDVRIWKTEVYKGKRRTTHYVRWAVAGRRRKKPFESAGLADSFRSALVSAVRKGEPFDIESGLPESMRPTSEGVSWYSLACEYVDLRWPHVAATTRRTHAEALTAVTTAMFTSDRGKPNDQLIRRALCRWGFNTAQRSDPDRTTEVRAALRWVETHTRPVSALADPGILRSVLDHLTVRLDGAPAASSVFNRRRKILNTVVEYAVERGFLDTNPIRALKWRPPTAVRSKGVRPVDRRRVANPLQVRTLLDAVREQSRSGERLVAFFACLYYAALRPEEAVALTRSSLALPDRGWGELHLGTVEPYAGREWTDSGEARDRRSQLKQREIGETRTVPCPPVLTAILRAHIAQFGYGPGGRLFVGEVNGRELPKLTIVRTWKRARERAFVAEVAASSLAATPYDLRHAAVSGWLNAGVPVPEVAEWAGHSPEVLLKIYAKCVDGGGEVHRRRIERFLGGEG